jgi:hypothetical protein
MSIHVTDLELDIEISGRGFSLRSYSPLVFGVYFCHRRDALYVINGTLSIYVVAQNMAALIESIKSDILFLWSCYVKEEVELALDAEEFRKILLQTFYEEKEVDQHIQ